MAGVSQATVSRVLAGDDRVEADIKDKVLAVVRDNNYRPDVRARSLRKQRANLIGLVLKRDPRELQGDPFFSMFVAEILEFLAETPYHLCVDVAGPSKEDSVYEDLLRTRRVDGVILVESEPHDERIRRLQNDQFPFVVVGNPATDVIQSVDNDNVFAGAMATSHLLAQGYRDIAFIAGPKSLTVSEDRVSGYTSILAERGLKPRVWYSDFGINSARDAARDALLCRERPDAIVVLDDYMAMGVVQASRELGISIPRELGIVSFNDTNLCDVLENGLTSVSLNIRDMVRISCTKLLGSIEEDGGTGAGRTIVPCELMVRGSSLLSEVVGKQC